jgi:DNA helicase HerA-like ATPase
VGDLEKPRLVFVFDEAHLLFDDAPPALHQRVEQVVRIIRSKGVGVFFCSQFPDDVPNEILGQLGNRIQHALRAYTPRDLKAVRTAAETFVPNPKLDVAAVIGQLAVGEALVSTLQEKGVPSPVQRTLICPPRCKMGAITAEERLQVMSRSPVAMKYDTPVNRESAHEVLVKRAEAAGLAQAGSGLLKFDGQPEQPNPLRDLLFGTKRRQGMVEAMAKQAARSVGGQIGNRIVRGLLGGITQSR